jgi:hypothetical protein
MTDKTIANDLHLCVVNAETAARHMTENARVYRDRRGPGRRLWFRLSGDPRNDANTAEVVKEIKVYGGRPFSSNGVSK